MKKIVFVTSRYPSKNNPYNHMFVHMRCVEFKKMGLDVIVYVPSKENISYIHEGIEVVKMPAKSITEKINKDCKIFIHLLNITPIPSVNGWYIYRYIFKKKLPYAMYVHGNEVQKHSAREFDIAKGFIDFLKRIKKDLYAIPRIRSFIAQTKDLSTSEYIFPSVWMKDELENNLNVKLNKFHIIPNGIDTELFKFNSSYTKSKRIITIRPLSSKKYAVDVAIKLMSYLPEDYTLDIYGKGELQQEYEQLINHLGLKNRVKILNNFIERQQLSNTLSNYGVFLSPTRMDAQGVMMCEAMASGLLTISSNNTAIPEFISDLLNGILIDNENIDAHVKKILDILHNEEYFNKVVGNAREKMEEIDLGKTAKDELEVLGFRYEC